MGQALSTAERNGLRKETLAVLSKKLGVNQSTIGRARAGGTLWPSTLELIRNYLATTNDKGEKIHWTQRPENKPRLRRQLKQMLKIKELKAKEQLTNGNGTTTHEHEISLVAENGITTLPALPLTQEQFERHLIFTYGKTYGEITAYCESVGLPSRDFARRVGILLQRS